MKIWGALLLGLILNVVIGDRFPQVKHYGPAVFGAFLFLAFLISMPIIVRRLHDRGKSGHWLWLYVCVPIMLAGHHADLNPAIEVSYQVAALAIGLLAFTDIGILSGRVGSAVGSVH